MNPVEIKDLPGLIGTEVGVSDWLLVDQDLPSGRVQLEATESVGSCHDGRWRRSVGVIALNLPYARQFQND